MELTDEEYMILKCNSINVSGVKFSKVRNGHNDRIVTTFHSVTYGKNIHTIKVHEYSKINMDRMKRKMVLITIDKSECEKALGNVIILNTRHNIQVIRYFCTNDGCEGNQNR